MFPVAPQTAREMMKEGTVGRLAGCDSTLLGFFSFFFKSNITVCCTHKRWEEPFFHSPAVPAVFFTPPPPDRDGAGRAPGRLLLWAGWSLPSEGSWGESRKKKHQFFQFLLLVNKAPAVLPAKKTTSSVTPSHPNEGFLDPLASVPHFLSGNSTSVFNL